jgi:hypothetical protein
MPVPSQGHYVFTVFRLLTDFVCSSFVDVLLNMFVHWIILHVIHLLEPHLLHWNDLKIRIITKLPNSEQSYKGKAKIHKYINRQNQSTTGKLWKPEFVTFNTSEQLSGTLENAWQNTETKPKKTVTFHSTDISDQRTTIMLSYDTQTHSKNGPPVWNIYFGPIEETVCHNTTKGDQHK